MSGESWVVTMPKLGETVTEGTISQWMKRVGDTVEFDDILFEVETDKVVTEIPSPYDGEILEIMVAEGETVAVGAEIVRIGAPGAGSAPTAGSDPNATGGAEVLPDQVRESAGEQAVGGVVTIQPAGGRVGKLYSPIVRRLAAENNLDLAGIVGSGVGGRIRREDVETAIARGPTPAALQPTAEPPGASTDARDQVVPLSPMRLAVAAGMVNSVQASPQVWTSVEVDYENIERLRRVRKAAFREETGASLSYLPFVARAVCEVLQQIPVVNASIDIPAKSMTLHPYVNLGIAVDLDEKGLIVPVLKNADQLNIRGLAQQIKHKAEAGRARKLPPDELTGSTFTITNPGRTYASAPIINQPNVGILCTEGVSPRPVAVGDMLAIHHVGILSLVYDHRAFDGVTGTRFLLAVKEILETRDWNAELG